MPSLKNKQMKKILLITILLLTLSIRAQQTINGKQAYIVGGDTIDASKVSKYTVDTILQIVDDPQLGACYCMDISKNITTKKKTYDKSTRRTTYTSELKMYSSSQKYRLKDSIFYDFLGYKALERYKKKEPEKAVKLSQRELDYFVEQAKIEQDKYKKEDSAYKGPFYLDKRDGQQYKIITIGEQTWFAQNLNYETENSWPNKIETYSAKEFGRYYTWEAAQKACPTGWHLPSDAEWQQLEIQLGMRKTEALQDGKRGNMAPLLKHNRSWFYKSEEGKGFNGVAAGAYMGSTYLGDGIFATWWTATKTYDLKAWTRGIHFSSTSINRDAKKREYGFSVRCVKD